MKETQSKSEAEKPKIQEAVHQAFGFSYIQTSLLWDWEDSEKTKTFLTQFGSISRCLKNKNIETKLYEIENILSGSVFKKFALMKLNWVPDFDHRSKLTHSQIKVTFLRIQQKPVLFSSLISIKFC